MKNGHYGTICDYGMNKKECETCYLTGCILRHEETRPNLKLEDQMKKEEKKEWVAVFKTLKKRMPRAAYGRIKREVFADIPELEEVIDRSNKMKCICNKAEECKRKTCVCIHVIPHDHNEGCDVEGGKHCLLGARCIKVR